MVCELKVTSGCKKMCKNFMVIRHSIKELLAKSMVTRPMKCIVGIKNLPIYLKKTLVVLLACLLEAVRTNPGYGMATLIYNNLLNLILGTVMLLRSNYIIQEKILLYLFK